VKGKLKVITTLAVSVSLVSALAACSKSDKNDTGSSASATSSAGAVKMLDPVTLKVMLFGDKPADMDKQVEIGSWRGGRFNV
jgi:putative aldouronate transport system substrate-binding protein